MSGKAINIIELQQEFQPSLDHEIQVRGFPYEIDGGWVLVAEPHLKLCCVSKKGPVIAINGKWNQLDAATAHTFSGRLVKQDSGYRLLDAKVVERQVETGTLALIFLLLGLAMLYMFQRFIKKKKRTG